MKDFSLYFQFNFVHVNEFEEELPKLENPNIVTLSDDNVVFNLIENVPIPSEDQPLPNTDIFLKPEPPDISPEIKTEGNLNMFYKISMQNTNKYLPF